MQPIFVSYSRRQLYFTEDLVVRLQASGLSVWFDLERLYPGTDWKYEIDAGLSECERLILVASQASLASKNVALEWQRALELNKPVVILLFEAVALPESLSNAPLFDAREDPLSAINRLITYLRGEVVQTDPPVKPSRMGIGITWRIPPTIRLLAFGFLYPGLIAIPFMVYEFALSPVNIFAAVVVALSLIQTVRFLRHRVRYIELRLFYQIVVAFAFPLGLVQLFGLPVAISDAFTKGNFASVLRTVIFFAGVGLLFHIYFNLLRHSETLLYWLPPDVDENLQSMRTSIRQWRAQNIKNNAATAKNLEALQYVLFCAQGDEGQAYHIANLLGLDKLMIKPAHVQNDAVCVAVISALTPRSDLAQLYAGYQSNLVGVLISPISTHDKDTPISEIEGILRYQFVDFRDGNQNRLMSIRQMFEGKGVSIQYAINTVPYSPSRLQLPIPLVLFIQALRIWGAAYMALSVLALLKLPSLAAPLFERMANEALGLFCGIGFLHLVLISLLVHRRVNYATLLALFVGLNGLGFVFRYPLLTGSSPFIFGIIAYGCFSYAKTSLEHWLPSRTQLIDPLPTFAFDRSIQVWSFNTLAVLLISVMTISVRDLSPAVPFGIFAALTWIWLVNRAFFGRRQHQK